MHINSLQAYEDIKHKKIGRRHHLILRAVDDLEKATDRQVMTYLNFHDPNQVRPRITELIKLRQLEECGTIKDPITGMSVRLIKIPKPMIQGSLI